jgi:hypothetical protein
MNNITKLAILIALVTSATCARESGEPEPESQVLVPCDPQVPDDDPLACPTPAAGLDAGVDATIDAAPDAP